MILFGVWKNWPKNKQVKHLKKLVIWSPILRCIMMTWFATAIWSMTWVNSSTGGFNYAVKIQPRGRMLDQTYLQGLASRYPT